MKTRAQQFSFQPSLLAIALLAVFGSAQAQDADLAALTKPDLGIVSIGAAGVARNSSSNRTFWGEYNGWGTNDGGVLLDFELIKRDDATGTWVFAEGRNLGLDNRELSFSRERQGQWKYSGEYNEQVRHDPRTLNTNLQGAGSTSPGVSALANAAASGATQTFDIKRKSYALAGEKWINPNFNLEVSFKSENKDGSRLSGLGTYCSSGMTGYLCGSTMGALLALPEPINSVTNQLEAKANFHGKDFSLTAGYYASTYSNDNGSMGISGIAGNNLYDLGNRPVNVGTGSGTLGSLLSQRIALAPDNQAQQFYVSGNYTITPTTRASFNYTQTRATQDENFAGNGLIAGAGLPANLGAAVETRQTQLGLTARPFSKLSLLGNVRLEETEDNTPHALYGGTFTNTTNSSRKVNSKAEASYLLPENVRATVGVAYAGVKRNVPGVGSPEVSYNADALTAIRENTNELTWRAELRKSISDTVNAALSYQTAKRDGSRWINIGSPTALYPRSYQIMRDVDIYTATGGMGTFPTTMMDRNRDSVKMLVDWMPMDKLSMQFALESGRDTYFAPTTKGLHNTGMHSVGIDASYALSDKWKTTGYVSYGEQNILLDHNAGYGANLINTSFTAGVGLVGKLNSKLEVGGEVSLLDDRNSYNLASGNTQPAGLLPDVTYNMLALKAYGKYALDSKSEVRVDLVHQRRKLEEWTWSNAGVPFAYSDNATVSMQPDQQITYLGVKYVYRFK